jgi:hypothetical protein
MAQATQIATELRQCIQICTECHAACIETTTLCLQLGGPHAEANHLRSLLDCAQLCATSADLMLRQSPLHPQTCGVCAEACRECAQSCEQVGRGDEVMSRCAEVCRRCEESCGRMAG